MSSKYIMEIVISETAPVLQVMTDISEIKNPIRGVDVKDNHGEGSTREPSLRQSSQFSNKKKFLHPIYGCNPYRPKANCNSYHPVNSNPQNNVSAFTQRIMSAKLLRVKQLQNQLTETQTQLNEVLNENRILKALHKRQDNALRKYEGSQEQLPQLIKSHNEEMRVVNSKYKVLRMNYREIENKLKQRDVELAQLREQHKHLVKLSKDKQLWDREKLTKKVEALEITIKEQQKKIQLLNRKVELEGKNHRHQLNIETNRNKEAQNQLRVALDAIKTLKVSAENKEKFALFPKKFQRAPQHSQLSFQGPARVSFRKNNQRLIQSENAMQDGIEVVTDSSMSNVTPNHCPQESSQDDPSYETSPHTEILSGRKNNGKSYPSSRENNSLAKEFHLVSMRQFKKGQLGIVDGEEVSNKAYLKSQGRSYTSKDLKKEESIEKNWPSEIRRISSGYFQSSGPLGKEVKQPANVSFYDRKAALNLRNSTDHGNDSLGSSSDSISQDEMENVDAEQHYANDFRKEDSSEGSGNDSGNAKSSNSGSFKGRLPSQELDDELQKEIQDMLEKVNISESEMLKNKESSDKDKVSNTEQGTSDDIERIVEEACKGMMDLDESDAELKEFEKYEKETWEELKKKVSDTLLENAKKEEEEEDDDDDDDDDDDIKLGDHQKANLLKALDQIDQEEKIYDKLPEKRNFIRTTSNAVERLHHGQPVCDNIKIPVLERIKKEDEEFAAGKLDKTTKKSNIMKELFG